MDLLDNEHFEKDGVILPLALWIEFQDIFPNPKGGLFLKTQ